MKFWEVRATREHDLPVLAGWLAPGADAGLPSTAPEADDHEIWLIAEHRELDGEHRESAVPGACLRLRRAIGLDRLRHWYHVGCVVHAAKELDLFHRQHTLLLGNDYTGATEFADLACDRAALSLAEQAMAIRTLVRAALLLIARDRERYPPELIVELPGLRDSAGQSPFWEGLGRHFYAGDPLQAAQRFGPAWRTHVAALLPRQPVYTSFLPAATQAAVAQVQPAARVMMEALSMEGLRYGHHVTIDEAGPVFEARIDNLQAVLGAHRRIVAFDADEMPTTAANWLIAMGDMPRVVVARAHALGRTLHLAPAARDSLGLADGDAVWTVPMADALA